MAQCPVCKNAFTPKPNGHGGTKSCSKACADKKRMLALLECPCGREFQPKKSGQKYCSRSCSNTFRRHSVQEKRFCLSCGEEMTRPGQKKYCRVSCQKDRARQCKFAEATRTGSAEGMSHRMTKRFLLETRGVRCEVCGMDTWMEKPIPLVLDHIDGNSENRLLRNLRLVCGNCDMQLPTYKGKNRGRGRHARRERYRNGQSY